MWGGLCFKAVACCAVQHSRRIALFFILPQRRPHTAIGDHQTTAAGAMRMVPEHHSQQVRRMNFIITHTGTSALCTTTKSKPDAAIAVMMRKRKRGRTEASTLHLAICSASVTGNTTGSGVHMPALMREESNNGPLPLASQWIRTPPEEKGTVTMAAKKTRGDGQRGTAPASGITLTCFDFGLICSFT